MDQLEHEELKNSVESLLSTLKCPVCLLLLEKDSILCTKGHAICKNCRGNQSSCPTCRSPFSNLEKNVIVSQILENIPHPCRFEKCCQLVKSGEDHEVYCRFRPTQCKFSDCKWVGAVDNLLFHLEDKHPKEKYYCGKKNLVKLAQFYVGVNSNSCFGFFLSNKSSVTLFSACGHYFWQLTNWDPQKDEIVKFTFLPLVVGKPTRDVYLRMWFRSEEKEHYVCMKTKMTPDNQCQFIFQDSMLSKNFCNENELKYNLLITEDRNEAINLSIE